MGGISNKPCIMYILILMNAIIVITFIIIIGFVIIVIKTSWNTEGTTEAIRRDAVI